MSLGTRGRTHFIGIGGAGMSAIAKVLVERGHEVSGSDMKPSRAATVLEAIGASIRLGHDQANVEGAARVVVSSAIPERNPELVAAREQGIPVLTRGEALAALLAPLRSIVVAGTHGKTTTTSMIVSILAAADLDPTYLVGAGLNDAGTNARSGRDDIAVAESDESDGSFLLLSPHTAVVTNLELDHVDYWGSFEDLVAGFGRFMSSVVEGGAVVVPAEDEVLLRLAADAARTTVTFGSKPADVGYSGFAPAGNGSTFRLEWKGASADVTLLVPGLHNVMDAAGSGSGLPPPGRRAGTSGAGARPVPRGRATLPGEGQGAE